MNIYEFFEFLRSMEIPFESLTDSEGRNLLHYAFELNATGIINSLSNNHERLSELIGQTADETSDFSLYQVFKKERSLLKKGVSNLYMNNQSSSIGQQNDSYVRNNGIEFNILEQLSHLTSVDSYLLSSIDINEFFSETNGLSFLQQAARDGDLNRVVYLVEKAGAEVNRKGNRHPALHYALENNHIEIAKILVERYGASFITPNDATLYSKLLELDIHVDLNQLVDSNNNTLLHMAVFKGANDLVTKLMTQHKVNLQAVNKDNKTSLDLAIDKNDTYTVKAIVDSVDSSIVQIGERKINHGIPQIYIPAICKRTRSLILINALRRNYSVDDFVKLGSKYFIDVNEKDKDGRTVLHAAIFFGEHYVRAVLDELHADPTIEDNHQDNPLDFLVYHLYHSNNLFGNYYEHPYPNVENAMFNHFSPNISMGLELLKLGVKPRLNKELLLLGPNWCDLMTLGCDTSRVTTVYDPLGRNYKVLDLYEKVLNRHSAYLEVFLSFFKKMDRSAIMFSREVMGIQNNTYDSCSSSSSSSNGQANIAHMPSDILKIISAHHDKDVSLISILNTYPLEVILQKWREAIRQVDNRLDGAQLEDRTQIQLSRLPKHKGKANSFATDPNKLNNYDSTQLNRSIVQTVNGFPIAACASFSDNQDSDLDLDLDLLTIQEEIDTSEGEDSLPKKRRRTKP